MRSNPVERLREIEAAMMPGPWNGRREMPYLTDNAPHIATLRNALPALIEVLEAATDLRATHTLDGYPVSEQQAEALADAEAEVRPEFDAALARLAEALR